MTLSSPIDPESDEPDHPEHIDRKVPPKIMRLTQHYHNLIYIRFFWESIGMQPPDWIKGELVRADAVLQQELQKEQGQGGLIHMEHKHETG
jgi:hypothetical protein